MKSLQPLFLGKVSRSAHKQLGKGWEEKKQFIKILGKIDRKKSL